MSGSLRRVVQGALWLGSAASLLATDLRGRVMQNDPYRGSVAATGVQVILQAKNGAMGKPSFTGSDGFFYIYGVSPGVYTIVVRYSSRATRQLKEMRVPLTVASAKNQDVRLIVLTD